MFWSPIIFLYFLLYRCLFQLDYSFWYKCLSFRAVVILRLTCLRSDSLCFVMIYGQRALIASWLLIRLFCFFNRFSWIIFLTFFKVLFAFLFLAMILLRFIIRFLFCGCHRPFLFVNVTQRYVVIGKECLFNHCIKVVTWGHHFNRVLLLFDYDCLLFLNDCNSLCLFYWLFFFHLHTSRLYWSFIFVFVDDNNNFGRYELQVGFNIEATHLICNCSPLSYRDTLLIPSVILSEVCHC